MTIEEAIRHCREEAHKNSMRSDAYNNEGDKRLAVSCHECAKEHEQLAEWLEELLRRREDMAVQRGQSARLEEALLQARKRVKELEGELKEELAKRAEAYDKLYAAYAKIDELMLAKEEQE